MTPPTTLPPRVIEFARAHVCSLLQLEALLHVFAAGTDGRSISQLSQQTYVPDAALTTWLEYFLVIGLCEELDGAYRVVDARASQELLAQITYSYACQLPSLCRLICCSPFDADLTEADT